MGKQVTSDAIPALLDRYRMATGNRAVIDLDDAARWLLARGYELSTKSKVEYLTRRLEAEFGARSVSAAELGFVPPLEA